MNRRTLLTIAFAVILVAAGFTSGWLWRGFSNPKFNSTEHFAQFLKTNVSNGMTVDQIRLVFGMNASMVDPAYPIAKISKPILRLYQSRPDGLKETDSFASFPMGDALVLFQLRDGRVINWGGTDVFFESAI